MSPAESLLADVGAPLFVALAIVAGWNVLRRNVT